MAPKATDTVVSKVKILTHGKLKLRKLFQAGSSASKEKEEKPLSKKELAAKKKVIQDLNVLKVTIDIHFISAKAEEDELSDEDKQLKEELELCVTRLGQF